MNSTVCMLYLWEHTESEVQTSVKQAQAYQNQISKQASHLLPHLQGINGGFPRNLLDRFTHLLLKDSVIVLQ